MQGVPPLGVVVICVAATTMMDKGHGACMHACKAMPCHAAARTAQDVPASVPCYTKRPSLRMTAGACNRGALHPHCLLQRRTIAWMRHAALSLGY